MPTYEYECNKCKYRFERFQKITDPPVKECPKCGGAVRRLISKGVGVIFKGSGFYETDYKRQNKANYDARMKKPVEKATSSPENKTGSDSPKTGEMKNNKSE
ncbi:zinc ribbon domain-containing protein [bacterium]|nr:zinc ribbon domain-containing protein [bacterium]